MNIKIVFISNFLNHHQLPLCKAMINKGIDFTFVATEDLPAERKKFGYEDMNKKYNFVITTYDNDKNIKIVVNLIDSADIVIIGSAPTSYIKSRLKSNKLTFRYNERIFKTGIKSLFNPKCLYYYFINDTIYQNKNFYLLAASAYAPYDFNLIKSFPKKMIKWGYFPNNTENDIDNLIKIKKKNKKIKILWCGRLIKIKHPELVIELAKFLKMSNFVFEINVVGCGELEDSLIHNTNILNLNDCINFVGSVPSQEVNNYMNEANIFIFTSDFEEGWGAVLNEAMNSACAIVASHAIGAVPFLIKNNFNGIIYENGNLNSFLNSVKKLMEQHDLRIQLGQNAYNYLKENYSANVAVDRLIKLYECNMDLSIIKEGVCSKANVINPKKMKNICKSI